MTRYLFWALLIALVAALTPALVLGQDTPTPTPIEVTVVLVTPSPTYTETPTPGPSPTPTPDLNPTAQPQTYGGQAANVQVSYTTTVDGFLTNLLLMLANGQLLLLVLLVVMRGKK